MTAPASGVLALQRLLELQLELARLALAGEQRTARGKAADLDLARQAQRDAAARGAALLHDAWHAAAHRGVLRHLAVLEQERARADGASSQAQSDLAAALQRTVDLDRRLAVLQRLQRQGERRQAAEDARAAAREADLLWLVRPRRLVAHRPGAGDAA